MADVDLVLHLEHVERLPVRELATTRTVKPLSEYGRRFKSFRSHNMRHFVHLMDTHLYPYPQENDLDARALNEGDHLFQRG